MNNQERKEKLKENLNNEIFQKVESLETKTNDKYDDLMTDKLSKILPKKEETEPSADTVEILVEEEVEIEVNDDSLLRDYDNFINESAKTLSDKEISEMEISEELESITNNFSDDTIVNVKQNNKPEKVVDENTLKDVDLTIEDSTTIDLDSNNEEIEKDKEDIKNEKRIEKNLKKEKKKELKKAQKENQKSGSIIIDVLLVLAIILLIALIMYLR